MLEIKFVRQHLDIVAEALKNRRASVDLEQFQAADDARRDLLQKVEALRHQRNDASAKIPKMKKKGEDTAPLMEAMRAVGDQIKTLESELTQHEEVLNTLLMEIPNIPHAAVPIGSDENDNTLVKTEGTPPEFEFEPLPHWDLGTQLGIFDFERARPDYRFPVSTLLRGRSPIRACTDQLYAGYPHSGSWLPGSIAALYRQSRQYDPHPANCPNLKKISLNSKDGTTI